MTPGTHSVDYLICVGSNSASSQSYLLRAKKILSQILSDFRCSPIYFTADAKGGESVYGNFVACGRSPLGVAVLSRLLKLYEAMNLRVRGCSAVTIDIDIVAAPPLVIRPSDFAAPHFLLGHKQLATAEANLYNLI